MKVKDEIGCDISGENTMTLRHGLQAHNLPAHHLPRHIAYTQGLNAKISVNLSNSCAHSLTVAELCVLAGKELSALGGLTLSYAPLAGGVELRQEIVHLHNRLNQNEFAVDETNVLTFCGAQEALSAVYQALLSPGDEIVVFTPNYPSLVTMAQAMGVKVNVIALTEANNWQMDHQQLAAKVNDKTKLIVINSPHNPTGSIIDGDTAKSVLALARKYNCYLLADDVSQASNYKQQSLAHDYLSYENSIVISVMFKSFGLAGLRIGWALTPNNALLADMLAIKASGSICCSVVDEQLALWALQNSDKILATNNQIIADNIGLFQQFVDNNHGMFFWQPPQAGIMTVVRAKLKSPIAMWAPELARKHGLLVLPASLFGLEGEYFRLGLGQKDFPAALATFQLALTSDF